MNETTKTPWDIEGKWSVSPYCWAPEVRKEFPVDAQEDRHPG